MGPVTGENLAVTLTYTVSVEQVRQRRHTFNDLFIDGCRIRSPQTYLRMGG